MRSVRIQRVRFRNFRSFTTFDVELVTQIAFVIGENAGGKTSLLTGIARALARDLSNFTKADFADSAQPIELGVTVTDLNDEQQAIFGNYVQFGGGLPTLELEARAVWNAAAEEVDVEHGYPRQPGSRSRREERDAIPLQWLAAGRDAARMLQFGVAKNLMGQLLDGLHLQASLDTAVDNIRGASRRLGDDPDLEQLLGIARGSLAAMLPAVAENAYSMGISALTPHDLLRQFELVVEHLGQPVPVPRQSSGIAQLSVFVFALHLAAQDPGTMLLVDEPEISLHPQSQRALMRALRALRSQIVIATHSASLLDRADPRTIVRLRRTTHGIALTRPSTLSDQDARRLSRFTSPQTAEGFFARTVLLVEGISDQLALEALADRRGRNLDAEGVAIVPIDGARSIASFLLLFGPQGFDVRLAGLCDENEESFFARGLTQAGLGGNLSRGEMEHLGFYVCAADLEDELIRSAGAETVLEVIDGQGDRGDFRAFQNQPDHRAQPIEQQLRGFIAARGRKIQYAPLLVDALDIAHVPPPLEGLLAHA
jgi:predicted ATPase